MTTIHTLTITLTAITYSQSRNTTSNKPSHTLNESVAFTNTTGNLPQWSFKDYLGKFSPARVWEEIQELNTRRGLKRGMGDEFEAMFKGIDDTDELLSLKVPNGNPKIVLKDGRRWEPPGGLSDYKYDRYSLNRRFLELMKQAIYQARDKMVIMQDLRQKYHKVSVYKMGFLLSKTDQHCKTFARFTFKAFKGCAYTRLRDKTRLGVIDLLNSYERSLNMWFEIELLMDLIRRNDENCERMMNQVLTNRKGEWMFED